MTFHFHIKQVFWNSHGDELSAIRTTVFVDEQNVPPELEWDEHDIDCVHLLAITETNKAIGTARMLDNGHIGRMAVLPAYRSMSVGKALLTELIKIAISRKLESVFLHSQKSATGFYEKSGFSAYGKEFMDAGIPHISMKLRLSDYTLYGK